MSSFEEENLYEMADDFLNSESAIQHSESPFLNDDHTKYCILQEIVESGTNAEVNILKAVKKKMVDGGNSNIRGLVKSLTKDGYNASLCHTFWPTTLNCPGGEYKYIQVLCDQGKRQYYPNRTIVDVNFKSQFEVAKPTPKYKELCGTLPPLFVGDEDKLKKIIAIVCREAKNSFHERGLYVPPWRTPCYMLSKWFSHHKQVAADEEHVLLFSSKVILRKKYLGENKCGLSCQFSSKTTTRIN